MGDGGGWRWRWSSDISVSDLALSHPSLAPQFHPRSCSTGTKLNHQEQEDIAMYLSFLDNIWHQTVYYLLSYI